MPARRAGLLLLLTSSALAAAAEDASPSMDFLEFLGEWEDADGTWMDSQIKAVGAEEPAQQEIRDDD